METHIEKGSRWYLVPFTWLKKLERYIFFDLIMAAPNSEEAKKANGENRDHPGGIDYSDIMETEEEDHMWLKEIGKKYSWQNFQLKENLREGEDFMLVNLPIIKFLYSHYQSE